MRAIFSLFILSLFLSAPASAKDRDVFIDKEIWQRYLARLVAYQPQNVGGDAYLTALGFKPYLAPGKELFRAMKEAKELPVLSVEGAALKFSTASGQSILLVRDATGDLTLNGHVAKLDPKKPLGPQVKRILSTEHAQSWSIFPLAQAMDLDGANGVVGGGVVATIAAAVSAGSAAMNLGYDLMGEMGLSDLACDVKNRQIIITATTGGSRVERRVFSYDKMNNLETVTLENKKSSVKLMVSPDGGVFSGGSAANGAKLTRPTHAKKLDAAQDLFADYHYLAGVCLDKERAKRVKQEAQSNSFRRPVYQEETPDSLSNSAE